MVGAHVRHGDEVESCVARAANRRHIDVILHLLIKEGHLSIVSRVQQIKWLLAEVGLHSVFNCQLIMIYDDLVGEGFVRDNV